MSIPGNGSLNGDLERRGIGCYCEDSLYYWMVHVHREEDFKILERLFSDLYCGSLWLNGYSILESVWEGNLEDIWHLPSDVGDEKERASHMACSMLPHLPAVGEPFHIISRDEKDSKAEHELCRYQNSTVSQWGLWRAGTWRVLPKTCPRRASLADVTQHPEGPEPM